jgi:hypothetical protein
MDRGRVGEDRGSKETDGCPLTLFHTMMMRMRLYLPYLLIWTLPCHQRQRPRVVLPGYPYQQNETQLVNTPLHVLRWQSKNLKRVRLVLRKCVENIRLPNTLDLKTVTLLVETIP